LGLDAPKELKHSGGISITPDRARELSSQAHKELQDEGYD